MGLKKMQPVLVEKKEPVKKVIEKIEKKQSKKIEEPKKEIIENKAVEKQKNVWANVGIIGSNEQINYFKAVVKMKGLKLGEELMKLITDFNTKNKI